MAAKNAPNQNGGRPVLPQQRELLELVETVSLPKVLDPQWARFRGRK
jgi:hypothetical protein